MDIFDASFKGVRRLQMYLAHVGYCLPDLQMDEQLIDFSHDPSDEAAARIIDACHVYRPDLFYGKVFFIKPSFDSLLQGKESQVYEISQVSRLAKDQYIKIGQMPYQIQNVLVHTTDWITSWYYRPLEDEVKNDRFTHRRDREGSNSVHSGFGDQLFDNPHSPGGEFNSPNKNQIPGQTGYGQSSSTSSSSSSQSEGYNEFSRYNEEEEQQSREFTPPPSSLPTTSASIDELIKSEIEKQNQKYKEKDKQKEKQKKNEKDQQKDKDRNKQIKLKDKNKEKEPINKKKKEIDKNKKKKNLKKDSKESSETDSPISSSQPSDSTTDHNDNDNINDNDNDRAPLSQIPESRLLEDDDYEDEEEDMHGAGFDEDNFLLQDDDDDDNDLNHSSENRKKGGADDSNQKKGKKVIVNADAQDDAEDNVYKFDFDKELQLQREQEKLKDAIGKKKKKKKKKKKITSASAEELEKQKKEQEAQFKIREHKLKEKRWRQEQHRAVRERKQQQKLKKDQELQEKMRIREAEVLAEAERNDQEELIMMGTVQDSELGKPERYEGLFNEGTFFVTTIFYVMLIFSFVFAVITAYNAFKLPIRNSPYQTMIVTSYGGYISPVPDTQPVEEPASDPAQETAYQQNDNKNMHNSIHFTSNSTKHNNNKNNLNLNHNSKPKNNSHSFITVDNQIRVINEEGDELLPEEVLDEEQEDQMKQKDSDLDKLCEFFNSIPENASEEEFETFAKSFGPVKEIIHQPRNSEYLRSAEVDLGNLQTNSELTLLNIIELIADRGLTQSKFPNFDTHTWKTQISHITIDYIPTLIKLINYKNDNYFNISGLQIYMQLSDIGYSGALTVALCIAGGRGIQDSSIVHGQQNEQIESEGGHEEIEALLFNSFVFGQSKQELFVNFDTPKFTARTHVSTINEQLELGDEIGKFLQSVQQQMLIEIELQLTLRRAVNERTQVLLAKVLTVMSGVRTSEINLWATNIFTEQNAEAWRREIQCPSLLPITSVPVTKRNTKLKENKKAKRGEYKEEADIATDQIKVIRYYAGESGLVFIIKEYDAQQVTNVIRYKTKTSAFEQDYCVNSNNRTDVVSGWSDGTI
ncbi:MAG: hypothetical protein EZS28_004994 [Streblomastix strix]|uniref:Uncharacterized protein n=1 Tax=Streblomastix strix TaxID=222440 RepID=A0A5J4WWQ8_9EUKA|nr:MAG: hypothetical protein EZS28_004994 [Streblomastix strix]